MEADWPAVVRAVWAHHKQSGTSAAPFVAGNSQQCAWRFFASISKISLFSCIQQAEAKSTSSKESNSVIKSEKQWRCMLLMAMQQC